jgi:hypothetical protein
MNKLKTLAVFLLFTAGILASQEMLKSDVEDYYEFLALQGLAERPYLNYRTSSDSKWNIHKESAHPWQNVNLGASRRLFGDLFLRIYGPELFSSFNTAAPYGQNDGALWQGKGFNASLTGGIHLTGYGVELTFKPQLVFSQNLDFDYIDPAAAYSGPNYETKASDYGYYGISSVDAPQRFGDQRLSSFDLGDTEIRYTWKTLTVGFGTQSIWLGPALINPLIHSNNAPSYPKLDLGLRKQKILIKGINLGDVETRLWWGYLSESGFFDKKSSNDHNLISGFSIAYGVPFLPGFSIGFNRTMLSKWENKDYRSFLSILIPKMDSGMGKDEIDQRGSVVFDYILPGAGLEIYFEWARNDYSPDWDFIIRYPFHTEAYTFGARKNFIFNSKYQGELLLEVTNLESSRDYEIISWGTTFYAHHIILQGYTNKGQWLGAGTGTGGNSQYLGFKLYYPKGYGQFFIQRRSPDLDYTWFVDKVESNIRASLDFGLAAQYFIINNFALNLTLIVSDEHNPLNTSDGDRSNHRINTHIAFGVKYTFK